jgi:predicted signal transduction protein with EAL and GGDEF domain/FixJ family two-component response regulator
MAGGPRRGGDGRKGGFGVTRPTDSPLILVVVDDRALRSIVHEVLLGAGFQVIDADDGNAALTLFREREPDAVLLDVVMSGIDGYEVCRRIRSLVDLRSVPILMMTGRDDLASIDAAYHAGATDFVPKPVLSALLPYRFRSLLRVSESLRHEREGAERLARAQRSACLVQWEHHLADGSFQWSEEVTEVFGIARESGVPGVNSLLRWVHPDDRAAVEHALASFAPHTLDYRMVLPDGRERIVHHEAEWVDDEAGLAPRLVGMVQDMTERWLAERRAVQLAYHDALTGLPNRTYLRNYLAHLLGAPERSDEPVAVLAIDLDGFTRVNDLHGLAIGDKLLVEVVERLRECLRTHESHEGSVSGMGTGSGSVSPESGDSGQLVARTAVDEFIVVLSRQAGAESCEALAARIIDRLTDIYSVQNSELVLSTSLGIAIFPEAGRGADELIQHAGAAMHHARESGKNQYQIFMHALQDRVLRRMQIERGLRSALDARSGRAPSELALHFQPRISLPSYDARGVEALVRWTSPSLGSVSPAEFIPVAEETGLIVELGEWVLRTACETMIRLELDMDLSVNISPRQFLEPGFVQQVTRVLRTTGFPVSRLELEITEGVVMQGTQQSHRVMEELKAMGARIVLDDFGTGYSSLSYLVRFPIDTLKIDRSFVIGLPSQKNVSVVAAIMALARGLEMQVVVEGVETQEQLDHFIPFGQLEIQGYYFSKPRPAEELKTWLIERELAANTTATARESTG